MEHAKLGKDGTFGASKQKLSANADNFSKGVVTGA